MRRLVLGTAGHIDHGKTALVHALTGVDTDRLPEEKRRGITIDLGFARLPLGDSGEIGIVDVPGHEAFIRNMLAGASGIDVVLLVVAADESVMPQTREHLAIVELLGIRRGIVALTKSDLVDPDWLDLVRDDVTRLLAPTPLAHAPIVAVSARTRAGLDTLVRQISEVAETSTARSSDDLFRMPIDRVFTVRGTGTVVTGTVWSGTVEREQHVRIEPAAITARVRGLQHHGTDTAAIGPGERAAIALAGIDRHALSRGDAVVAGAGWAAGSILTVRMTSVRDLPTPIRPRQRVRVHVGTAEVLGRIALLDGALRAGTTALAQIRLESPLLARAGDHFVIRSYSPILTIGGGLVLEPSAPKRKRLTDVVRTQLLDVLRPQDAVAAVLALGPGPLLATAALPVLTGLTPARVEATIAADRRLMEIGENVVDAATLDRCTGELLRLVRACHAAHPLDDGIEREVLRRQVPPQLRELVDIALLRAMTGGALVSRGASLADPQNSPAPTRADHLMLDRIRSIFATAGLQPPTLEDLPADLAGAAQLPLLMRLLERESFLVKTGPGRWTATSAILDAIRAIRTQLPVGQPLDIDDFRSALGLSRKYLIPLLEYLDRSGVTVRRDAARVLTSEHLANPAPDRDGPVYAPSNP